MAWTAETVTHGVFSDVHGNLPALQAVLKELDSRGATQLWAAGDHLWDGDDPLEVWRLLRDRKVRCGQGLADRALAVLKVDHLHPMDPKMAESLDHLRDVRRNIGDLVLEELRRLPVQQRVPLLNGGEMLVVHGSPGNPVEEIAHDTDGAELLGLLNDDPADLVLCAGSHVPFDHPLEECHLVGLGSVGQAPEGNTAHFAVVRSSLQGFEVELAWVEY